MMSGKGLGHFVAGFVSWLVVLCGASQGAEFRAPGGGDPHSYGNPGQVRVEHISLRLRVDFGEKRIIGEASLLIDRAQEEGAARTLVLDTRELLIDEVRVGAREPVGPLAPAQYELGEGDPVLGKPLSIELPAGADWVVVEYRTSPDATALQWVSPAGTAGGKSPFLYTQSQSIHARSWIPCQDSPGVRVTYDAAVEVPGHPELEVVMSAEGPEPKREERGRGGKPPIAFFRMEKPIPPYLIALAVGDLKYQPLGPRTGVWAEPSVLEAAAWEFADTEKMLAAAERLFGPYRWGRYDILVLPPSFPFGGMENARLTFATPTIIAGDRSLVALVAHELGHSWSGNLATCATWEHLWINEGLTTYLERRIVEAVYGPKVAKMERELGYQDLLEEMKELEPRDQALVVDLKARNPDEALTGVPYEKGALFLTRLETLFGREGFDEFLRGYFDDHEFQSLESADFVEYMKKHLFSRDAEKGRQVDVEAWLGQPGLPAETVVPVSESLREVGLLAKGWSEGKTTVNEIGWNGWSTLERLSFLRALPARLDPTRMGDFDEAFEVTAKSNPEVLVPWLERAIRSGYEGSNVRLEKFLMSVGRQKYLVPLYKAMTETEAGRVRAGKLFAQAQAGYHPIARQAISKVVGVTTGP